MNVSKQVRIDWTRASVRRAVRPTESSSILRKEILCTEQFALLPVDLKTETGEVFEHMIYVRAKPLTRLCYYEPVVEIRQDANTTLSLRFSGF